MTYCGGSDAGANAEKRAVAQTKIAKQHISERALVEGCLMDLASGSAQLHASIQG